MVYIAIDRILSVDVPGHVHLNEKRNYFCIKQYLVEYIVDSHYNFDGAWMN